MHLKIKHLFILLYLFLLIQLSHAQETNNLALSSSINAFQTFKPITERADFIVKNKFLYRCWEENKTLHFCLIDIEQNQKSILQSSICPVFYFNKKNQLSAQSLQIMVDTASKTVNKRIYISWADQKNGLNNWDVFLVYSDDLGVHWTEPLLITYRPNHKNQLFPKMHVDSRNGDLYLLYLDQQNYLKNTEADVYVAKSTNGGLKFEYAKLNGVPLKVNQSHKFQNTFIQTNQALLALWTINAKKRIYTLSLTDTTFKNRQHEDLIKLIDINNTFRFEQVIKINIESKEELEVDFELTKPIEPAFKHITLPRQVLKKGNNQLLIDTKALSLKKGNYTLILYYKGINKYIWITEE